MNDKEKLEAIKKVLDDIPIPIMGFSDNILEEPLVEIRAILNS